jgi:MAGUK p55 subfamily member 3/7
LSNLCLFKDTSRPKRPNEISGREYLFVTREKMESDIENNKLIEHGEFRGQLYGTTAQSVKSIIESGAFCILR